MNEQLVFGLFAFYVVVVSLYGILSGGCDARLAFVRKAWGRIQGLTIYFCVHVVLPLLIGIVFFGLGVANFQVSDGHLTQNGVFEDIPKIKWQIIHEPSDPQPKPEWTIPLCA